MKDWQIVVLITVAVVNGIVAFIAVTPHGKFHIVGAPASVRCGFENSQGVSTCIDGSTVYTCLTDWTERVIQCAPAPGVAR